jgi:hypothetical protein
LPFGYAVVKSEVLGGLVTGGPPTVALAVGLWLLIRRGATGGARFPCGCLEP